MNRKRIAITIGILIVAFALFVPTSFARIISQNNTYTLEADEVVDDDLFVGAETIVIAGTVEGDVYAAGERVTISGTVNGDVYAGASIIEITGTIEDDVLVAGGNVDITGASIGDSVHIGAGNVEIEDTDIGGALMFGAGTVDTNAVVGRGMYGAAGTVSFDGEVARDAWIGAGLITAGTDAVIMGNLTYSSESQDGLPENLTVDGEVSYIDPAEYEQTNDFRAPVFNSGKILGGLSIGFLLWSYSAALLIGILFIYLFKGVVENVVWTIRNRFVPSMGWGFLVLLALPWVVVFLMFTLVGLPLSFLLMGLFALELYFAHIFLGLLYGTYISESFLKSQNPNMYINFALGLGLYYVISLIPFVNTLQLLIAVLVSIGAIFTVKRQRFFGSSDASTQE